MPFSLPKWKPEFSKLEESILQYWKEHKTFEKSVESRPAENPYRFYDGPPFITGTPHYGTLLSSIIKDVVPRYQTMLGKRVERVWGWDCHGLPIEQKVQKKLGLESNKEIEESAGGIQGFIDECYAYTRDTSAEWSWYIDHIGRWVDMDNAYRTMDQNYMESVMWVFKQIWEKGYIYEGKRVSWYSWKLSTPISNFEIAMDDSYQDVQDPAITVKFPLREIKKGAGAIIRDEAGKLLMIRNKKDGLWRVPWGHVEEGESYHDAAARELLEETGISCKLEPMYNFYHTYRGAFYYAERFSGTVSVGHKVTIEAEKYTDYEYFSLDALPVASEIHPVDVELIEYLTGIREIIPVTGPLPVSCLAWTTTPWTMPMHMALAVNNDITYAQVLSNNEIFILAQSRVETVFKGKGDYQVIGTMHGKDLVGLHYNPPFDYYVGKIDEKNFRVYHADFVTDTDGTGIAHEAPEFGDVDFQLAKQEGINITSAIDEAGKYTSQIPDYQGQLYLDCIDPITERLKTEGKLFKKEGITHRVPYCPRSNTPLMQKAQKSWFIDIQRIKSELIAQNEHINWFPDHFKHGRFLKSLESAPDWCISRSRFWWTPMPVWQNADGSERVVIDSREELYQKNKPLGQITKLIFVRHAESEANVLKMYNDDGLSPLTEKWKNQAKKLAEILQKEWIEIILSSPFLRAKQTAEPISKMLGLEIIEKEYLHETNHGELANQTQTETVLAERKKFFEDYNHKFWATGESFNDLLERWNILREDIQKNYSGKTILVVSHGHPVKAFLKAFGREKRLERTDNATPHTLYLDNDTGKELNLHRPTIDTIELPWKNGNLKRIPEVLDVWMDSASMPYAQVHYPFSFGEASDIMEATTESEREMCFEFFKKLWKEEFDMDFENSKRPLADIRADFWKSKVFYLKKDNILASSIQVSTQTIANNYVSTWALCMWRVGTLSSYRKRGLGSRLIKKALQYVASLGVKEMYTNAEIKNIEYYQWFGFESIQDAPENKWNTSAVFMKKIFAPEELKSSQSLVFPADFIAEYTGQIRAWFYVMHAIGVMVKWSPAFKNVAVTGVINGTDGRKMSKSYGNYPDPRETIQKYGADAIRFYLMGGTLMKGEDMAFSEAGIQESIKRVLLPLWNSYTFFATYANIDGWEFADYSTKKTHELDTWIISRLHTLIQDVRSSMDAYDLQKTCDAIMLFLDGLNNWYIRRNRRRFWRSELDADKKSAYETLHEVLVTMTKLLAPICPFITEHLYQNLMNTTDSVHLTDFPEANKSLINLEVNQKMTDLQALTNLGLAIRGREKLRVRQPLRSATVTLDFDESARETLAEELNVKEIHTVKDVSEYVTITYSPDAKKIGATERKQWMKTIIADAKAGKWLLTSEGTLELVVSEAPSGKVMLGADEFEAVYTPKEGSTIAFAGSAGYVIGLDTTLDEALTLEGYARDMIRAIQDARKELGFQVTDRLHLSLTSENEMLAKILEKHQSMIEKETLTTITIGHSNLKDAKEIELDEGFVMTLILSK